MALDYTDFLPGIFRKKKDEPPQPWDEKLPGAALSDAPMPMGGDDPTLPNLAAPIPDQPSPSETRPRMVNPPAPVAAAPDEVQPAPVPAIPPTPQPMNIAAPQEPAPQDPATTPPLDTSANRPARRVMTDSRGRPIPQINAPGSHPDMEAEALDYNRRLQEYRPEAAKGWRRYAAPIAQNALRGFAAGGLPGAVFGAAGGAVQAAVDPTTANREWQQRELARSNPQVAGILARQKASQDRAKEAAAIESTKAETALHQAQTLRTLRDPAHPGHVEKGKDGYVHLINTTSGVDSIVHDKNGKPLEYDPTVEYRADGGVLYKIEKGKKPEIIVDSRVTEQTDTGPLQVTPGQALQHRTGVEAAKIGAEGKQVTATEEKTVHANIAANIRKQIESDASTVKTLQAKLNAMEHPDMGAYNAAIARGELPPNTPPPEPIDPQAKESELPYEYQETKREIQRLQTKMKDDENRAIEHETQAGLKGAEATGAGVRGRRTGGQSPSEAQIRADATAKGLNPEIAVQRAKDKGILPK